MNKKILLNELHFIYNVSFRALSDAPSWKCLRDKKTPKKQSISRQDIIKRNLHVNARLRSYIRH